MATIIKLNARKLLDSGQILSVSCVDLPYPGLGERQHFCFLIGAHVIRIERKAGEKLGLKWTI